MIELLWLLLPVAAASGWWVANRQAAKSGGSTVGSAEYFKGLNYLINDKPDQAIEVLTRMADVDQDTAEIHLALGNLFRRRGEVDRAIHIHGSLIARTHLTVDQRHGAVLELGEDYLRAGLFDRAEALFQELLDQPDPDWPQLPHRRKYRHGGLLRHFGFHPHWPRLHHRRGRGHGRASGDRR